MSELKTLKDIQFGKDFPYLNRDIANVRDLKEEAIKWIKEINNWSKQECADGCCFKGQDSLPIYVWNDEQEEAMIRFIKYFFNLTEEGLQ